MSQSAKLDRAMYFCCSALFHVFVILSHFASLVALQFLSRNSVNGRFSIWGVVEIIGSYYVCVANLLEDSHE